MAKKKRRTRAEILLDGIERQLEEEGEPRMAALMRKRREAREGLRAGGLAGTKSRERRQGRTGWRETARTVFNANEAAPNGEIVKLIHRRLRGRVSPDTIKKEVTRLRKSSGQPARPTR